MEIAANKEEERGGQGGLVDGQALDLNDRLLFLLFFPFVVRFVR